MVEVEPIDVDVSLPDEPLNEAEDFKESYSQLAESLNQEEEQEENNEEYEEQEAEQEQVKTTIDLGQFLLFIPSSVGAILHKANPNYEMTDEAKQNITNDIKLILEKHSVNGEVEPEIALGIHSLFEAIKFIFSMDKFKERFKNMPFINKGDNNGIQG